MARLAVVFLKTRTLLNIRIKERDNMRVISILVNFLTPIFGRKFKLLNENILFFFYRKLVKWDKIITLQTIILI